MIPLWHVVYNYGRFFMRCTSLENWMWEEFSFNVSWQLSSKDSFDSRLIMNLIGSILGSIVLVLGNIQDFRQYSRVGRVR